MAGRIAAPSHQALVEDLVRLRETGLAKLRQTGLPALADAARLCMAERNLDDAPAIEQTVRTAIAALDSGEYGDAALALFGLSQGLRARSSGERREKAAAKIERSADTFRRRYEPDLLASIADHILIQCADQQLRETREQLEHRHPAESRLAVQWVERFEAYHRMWTPAWALGAELTAYRFTLLEPGRPYDRSPGTDGPDDPGYTQELQAEGYARYALYRWAWLQWQLRQFTLRHGGLWLLSTAAAEQAAADAIYAIDWHVTVFNERDHSWLRNAVAESKGQEMDHFLHLLASTPAGTERWREWQEWCAACGCTWDISTDDDTSVEHFPTADSHRGIRPECQMHAVVAACGTYCDLIESEWHRIADWYHLGDKPIRGVNAAAHYLGWRQGRAADG